MGLIRDVRDTLARIENNTERTATLLDDILNIALDQEASENPRNSQPLN